MKKVVFALIAVGLMAVAAPALATGPTTGTGGNAPSQDPDCVVTKVAGGNLFLECNEIGTFYEDDPGTGIEGFYSIDYTMVIRADGKLKTHGLLTCDPCTVGGQSGSYVGLNVVKGDLASPPFPGNFTIISGMGDLSDLRGQGKFTVIPGVGGRYEFNYHFEP